MIRGRQLDRSSPDESGKRVELRYSARDYRDCKSDVETLIHERKSVRETGRSVAPNSGASPRSVTTSKPEAIKCLAGGESCRSIGKTFGVHHATIARLAT